MADDDFSKDPFDEVARKAKALWTSAKHDYDTGTTSVERLTVLTNLLTATFTFGLLVVGAVAAVIYGFQLMATQDQLTVMQEQLESADRPWLKITNAVPSQPLLFPLKPVFDPLQGRIVPSHTSVNTGIKVTVENVGHSVALDVVVRPRLILMSPFNGNDNSILGFPQERTYAFRMQQSICSDKGAGLPINLFPGDDNQDQTGDAEDIPLAGKTLQIGSLPGAQLIGFFVGCVDYRINTSGKTHQSYFIYELKAITQDRPDGTDPLAVGENIPASHLKLEKFAFGGFDAN